MTRRIDEPAFDDRVRVVGNRAGGACHAQTAAQEHTGNHGLEAVREGDL
jgi:hypothetical protein